MPNIAFLSFAVCAGSGAYWLYLRGQAATAESEAEPAPAPVHEERELGWEDVGSVDEVSLEVGYRLIPMVDRNQGGQLLSRIKGVRKKLTQDLGFLLPQIHIRDNLDLEANAYRIAIKDSTVARESVQPDAELAINPGQVFGELPGSISKDPVFGLDAVWIEPGLRDQAQTYGYTVVDASTVIATHMSQLLQEHGHELIGHQEVQALLDRYSKSSPNVIEEVIPKIVPLGVVVKVMQNLLRESIPIRDTRTIIETIVEMSTRTQDPNVLSSAVRIALGRLIVERITGDEKELPVMTLNGSLEQLLQQTIQSMAEGSGTIEPGLAQRLVESLKESCERQEVTGQPTVLLVPDGLREMIARFVRHSIPRLNVLSFSEIPENRQIKIIGSIGGAVA
jgi:flagellar biosynthesis protein FlhA